MNLSLSWCIFIFFRGSGRSACAETSSAPNQIENSRISSKLDHAVAPMESFPATIYFTMGNSIYLTTNAAVRNYPVIMKCIIDALSHPGATKKKPKPKHISLNIHPCGRASQRQSLLSVCVGASRCEHWRIGLHAKHLCLIPCCVFNRYINTCKHKNTVLTGCGNKLKLHCTKNNILCIWNFKKWFTSALPFLICGSHVRQFFTL